MKKLSLLFCFLFLAAFVRASIIETSEPALPPPDEPIYGNATEAQLVQPKEANQTLSISVETDSKNDSLSGVESDFENYTKIEEKNDDFTRIKNDGSIPLDELIIPTYEVLDVAFVLDTTGSMSAQIAEAKNIIENIILSLKQKVLVTNLQLRFGVVAYRDHPPQDSTYVTLISDFTNDLNTIEFVQNLQARGGGDRPEAVHNALYDAATKLNWKDYPESDELRYIFHIADAHPHGKQYSRNEDQEGCLCGLQTDEVIKQINDRDIHFRLLKVRPYAELNTMDDIFREKITNYESETVIEQTYYYPRPSSPSEPLYFSAPLDIKYSAVPTSISGGGGGGIVMGLDQASAKPGASASGTAADLKYVVADYIIKDLS